MNTKEFVTKIIIESIRSKQRMIRGLSIRKKLVLPGIMVLLSLVSGNSIAYAQTLGEQQQQQLADPIVESLNMAKTKVEVATSVGAFGNGVPELYNISVQDLMLVFTITAVGAIVTYIAIRMLLPHFRRMKITLTNIPQTVV
jgi:energy-converting hydrogenase Eha subunit E